MRKSKLLTLSIAIVILLSMTIEPSGIEYTDSSFFETRADSSRHTKQYTSSASSGERVPLGKYLIIQEAGLSIDAHGVDLLALAESEGVVATLKNVSDLMLDQTPLNDAIAVVLDASLGADNGTAISASFIDLLIMSDVPVILMGRSAWLLHSFRGEGPPQQTAPASLYIYHLSSFAGAVYTSLPYSIPDGALLTNEMVSLPLDKIQTTNSRLVNLTDGLTRTEVAPFRHDSYPLDTFLLSLEDPTAWTTTGRNLFINILAYSTTLRENKVTSTLGDTQSNDLLEGGFEYPHESSLKSIYYAISTMYSILDSSNWTSWVNEKSGLVKEALDYMYVDSGSEAGFLSLPSSSATDLRSTAQGLWISVQIGLGAYYDTSKLVSYISSRQDGDGGFGNILTSSYVTEALSVASSLGSINTVDLEAWLRDCVITGSDTSDPNRWGGIAYSPSSTNPQNNYATLYVLALRHLGKAHDDPSKLTSWILTRTQNGDGSFDNSLSDGSDLMLGTASALTTMEILGTLSSANRSAGIDWIALNQLDSGGFGLDTADADIVAKTKETSKIAICLDELSVIDPSLRDGIVNYINGITTPLGFEGMEWIPTLMWGSWISSALRYAHAGSFIDRSNAQNYLDLFPVWAEYPSWSNLTTDIAPEYNFDRYTTKGVWAQYFGISMSQSLGIAISPSVISEVESYLSQCQYVTGHYKPSSFSGTAHMQYSVAAVETLYQIDSLDTINYRSSLENAILSEYSAGSWDMGGWTLDPFGGSQEAVDWLSTRAAIRLDLLDSTMASAIASNIENRIQYDDLWALSRDVATLALLNASYSIDLEEINSTRVVDSLDTSFENGWFNSTEKWQPVYTEGVLEMISILGLRTQLIDPLGAQCAISLPLEVNISNPLEITLTVTSSISIHSVYVYAFNEWTRFEDVNNSDVLSLSIPDTSTSLGEQAISVMIWDLNSSRCYAIENTSIVGSLDGSLTVHNPTLLVGDLLNATASFWLASGGDAGVAEVTVRLGNEIQYQEWYYNSESPISLSLPTTDFDPGNYNLSVSIQATNCETLLLQEPVELQAPHLTYLVSNESMIVDVDETVLIPCSLLFQENDSSISGQIVYLSIQDDTNQSIHTDSLVTAGDISYFSWTPFDRGNYTFKLDYSRNSTIESCSFSGTIDVMEQTSITWYTVSAIDQYDTVSISLQLTDSDDVGLQNHPIHLQVSSPTSQLVYDGTLMTNSSGLVNLQLQLDENGNYTIEATFDGSGLLHSCYSSMDIITWSDSYLTVGGIPEEGYVNTTWTISVVLVDSIGSSIIGESIEVTITYLPSTIVYEATLTTNTTGEASFQWSATSPGSYLIEMDFSGSSSRSAAYDSAEIYLRIPVTLSISQVSDYQLGIEGWCFVEAINHDGQPIDGLDVSFVVRDPSEIVYFQTTVTIINGYLNISWTPEIRGPNRIEVSSNRSEYFEAAEVEKHVGVFDNGIISIGLIGDLEAVSDIQVEISVTDSQLVGVDGLSIHTVVSLDGVSLVDVWNTTPFDGVVILTITLVNPGELEILSQMASQDWLRSTNAQKEVYVKGSTSFIIDWNGLPVSQGMTVGYLSTLYDWESVPMQNSPVLYQVFAPNGSLIDSASRTTGLDGTSAYAFTFDEIGDFIVCVNYTGSSINSESYSQIVQRVTVTPTLLLNHSPTSLYGDSVEIQVGIQDAFGDWMTGLSLNVSIQMNGEKVFESITPSSKGLVSVHWSPSLRGIATIELSYEGSVYIKYVSTRSSISILEQVSGTLAPIPSSIDLGNETTLVYYLTCEGSLEGVTIQFQVLDSDLVPIWTAIGSTNTSGIAEVSYTASDATGVLTAVAVPTEDQFMIGGDAQSQIIVMTYCHTVTAFLPSPAALGGPINISIECTDDLGSPINGLSVRVELFHLGQPVKLGYLTNWVTVQTENGMITVEFTPDYSGSYELELTSSGSISVHGFTYDSYHIVHNPTSLEFIYISNDLEVGDDLLVIAKLTNFYGEAMEGHNIDFSIESLISPVSLITNETGFAEWVIQVNSEGLWTINAEYDGVGVYLPDTQTDEIDVRYGTQIFATRLDTNELVAGEMGLSIDVLLEDTGGNPLEGRTINYQIYHDTIGFIFDGSFVQSGQQSEIVNLTLDRMGEHTIIFSFDGTDHYHPSSSAVEVFVLGTSEIVVDTELAYDKSTLDNISISLLDELGNDLDPNDLDIFLILDGQQVNVSSRVYSMNVSIDLHLGGLEVGNYSLEIELGTTSSRIGCSTIHSFNVTSVSMISLANSSLSGLIGQLHSVGVEITDSINNTIPYSHLFVSIYAPDGSEIYGSILSTRTLIDAELGYAEIEWTPVKTGNYTVILAYEGTDYIEESKLTLTIETKYETNLDVTVPESIVFPESGRVMVTLSGGTGKISGASIIITISTGESSSEEVTLVTDIRGLVQLDAYPSFAGNMSIYISYAGNEKYAPCSFTATTVVYPDVSLDIIASSEFYLGINGSISVDVAIDGLEESWIGTISIKVYNYLDVLVRNQTTNVSALDQVVLYFHSDITGVYNVIAEVSNIPVIGSSNASANFVVTEMPVSIPMDPSSSTVIGSGVVLGIIGIVLRRKLSGALENVSVEWDV